MSNWNTSEIPISRLRLIVETNNAGERVVVEKRNPSNPGGSGNSRGDVFLTVRVGHKKIEFEKCKTAIRVGTKNKLETVLNTVIAATQSGELDAMIPQPHFFKSIIKSGGSFLCLKVSGLSDTAKKNSTFSQIPRTDCINKK